MYQPNEVPDIYVKHQTSKKNTEKQQKSSQNQNKNEKNKKNKQKNIHVPHRYPRRNRDKGGDPRMANSLTQGSSRGNTSWIPLIPTTVLTFLLTIVGLAFVPTHTTAMPAVELKNSRILHLNPTYLQPITRDRNTETLRAYHALCDKWSELVNPTPADERWRIASIVKHSDKRIKDGTRSIFYKAQFSDGMQSWFTMDTLRIADPFTVINHAYTHGYWDTEGYEWIKDYMDLEKDVLALLKGYNTSTASKKKYKFGVEVPSNPKHALFLDKLNGNDGWRKSIKLELDQIMSYQVFKALPRGYRQIPYHIVFDVKFDGRLKSRLVAGGHRTPEVPREDAFSGVIP